MKTMIHKLKQTKPDPAVKQAAEEFIFSWCRIKPVAWDSEDQRAAPLQQLMSF